MRIETAPEQYSYIGSFIYEHDGEMETMRVAHRMEKDGFRQRLFSMTGSAREIIRDNEGVWCYLPDKKIGVHEYQQSSRNNFLQIRGEQIHALDLYYDLKLVGEGRIADRSATILNLRPKDRYRYGYVLWADKKTGLLLRTDLVDGDGEIIERYMFVDIEIGVDIADSLLEPRTPRDSLAWFGIEPKPGKADANGSESGSATTPKAKSVMHWDSNALPPGFKLAYSINRREPMADKAVEHHVYSDGLSSVSLFVKTSPDNGGATGLSRMGAVSAYVKQIEGYLVTVIGEVPESAVSMIADGVTRIR
ncbi:MAG: sigma factor AlgU regulatory protein MucB [marine bacterium B5-7]|nr:MAG: sigma factor AlgU regulatory protein MucB [marine bacterium B5-7]